MGAVESAKKKITKKQSKQYIKKVQAYYEPIVLGDEKADFIDANPAAISLFKAKSKKQICSKGPNGLSADFQPAFNLPTSRAAPLAIQSAFKFAIPFFVLWINFINFIFYYFIKVLLKVSLILIGYIEI
eukprot:Anaeramoba_ignava/c21282_g1_i1.p1 GENE.c21282_g1_i1~~c21282_g1_i1.p1  ORF type:complete len:129 (+),score=33.44 c21282_g1_i1:97-483(+)